MTDLPGPDPLGYVGGRILDAGALVQIATGRSVYGRAIMATAVTRGQALIVSTAALAAARASAGVAGRAQLHVLLDLAPILPVPLGLGDAEIVGDLLATAGVDDSATDSGHDGASAAAPYGPAPAGAADGAPVVDVAAAHVVWLALNRGQRIVTDRPDTLRALGAVEVDELP